MSSIATVGICGLLLLTSLGYYLRFLVKFKESDRGNKVLASAGQVTFSGFIIGFGVIMILINTIGISKRNFINVTLYHTTFVSVLNMVSLFYYNKTID